MTVLFTSGRPFEGADNIKAVWDAYTGEKAFKRLGWNPGNAGDYPEYSVVVTDEFIQTKADNQVVVMIAHGLTGGKLYGASQKKGQFTREACALVDYYVTSSEFGIPFAASAAGIAEEKCLPLGMPRTDAYFGLEKGDGRTFLAGYARAYLYAPTFRAWYDEPMPPLDYEAIDAELGEDEILVVRRHRNTPKPLLKKECNHIVEIGSDGPPLPYLVDCDVLATDYSSILFDGYMLGKPSVLVAGDMSHYLKSRGMYMSYPWDYSSRHIRDNWDTRQLVSHLRAACVTGMREPERKCLANVAGACDGHSAERVAGLVRMLEAGESNLTAAKLRR